MSRQQEINASRWIQNQEGLKVLIGEHGSVTITNGVTVEVTGVGFVDAVRKVQQVLKYKTNNESICFYKGDE
mgnify:CR=1 FL=1